MIDLKMIKFEGGCVSTGNLEPNISQTIKKSEGNWTILEKLDICFWGIFLHTIIFEGNTGN